MEKKRVLLGVQKKKKPIRNDHKKKLLRNVIHYLKSDCYMYAPLASPPPKSVTYSLPKGKEFNEPAKREPKRLLERIGSYLKSDTYLYAPLILPKSTRSPATGFSGPSEHLKKVTLGESLGRSAEKEHRPRNQPARVTAEDQLSKGYLTETRIACQQTSGNQDIVKRMVYEKCSICARGLTHS